MKILKRNHAIYPFTAIVTKEEYLTFKSYCELIGVSNKIIWTNAAGVGSWGCFPMNEEEKDIFKDFMKVYKYVNS